MMKMFAISMMIQAMVIKNHMAYVIIILLTCSCLAIIMFLSSLKSWLSLMIMLIYISGIMVLFMFVVSLMPNEKSASKIQKNIFLVMTINLMVIMQLKMKKMMSFSMKSNYIFNIKNVLMMTTLILMSTYLPPIFLIKLFKGMKSSK